MKSNRQQKLFWAAMVVAVVLILIWMYVAWDRVFIGDVYTESETITSARPIGRASFVKSENKKVDSTKSSVRLYEPGYKKSKNTNYNEWEARPANDEYYIIPDSMVKKVIFPKCTWENSDITYLAKINDSTFVLLRLPEGRVEPNTEFMDRYFTRVRR